MASKQDTEQDGVTVPEEFQQKVHAIVHNAPKAHLAHIRARVASRADEIRQEEQAAQSGGKKGVPAEYSTEEMPQD